VSSTYSLASRSANPVECVRGMNFSPINAKPMSDQAALDDPLSNSIGSLSQGTDIFNDRPIPTRPSSKHTNRESMIDDSPLRTFLWEVGTNFSF